MITKENIAGAITNYLSSNNLFIVDITISKDDDIEITIESSDSIVKIENCIDIDHIVSDTFNRDDHDYSLTVTSAGLDQPFKVFAQYEKFKGEEVEVMPIASKSAEIKELSLIKKVSGGKIIGILSDVSAEGMTLRVTEKVKEPGAKKKVEVNTDIFFPFNSIKSCKPVIKFK